MWIWSASGKTLVNTTNVLTIDLAETWDSAGDKYAVRAHVTGDYTELKTGTEAECKEYLEQLDRDLTWHGDRVATALEGIEEQGEQDKRIKELQSMADAMEDAGFTWNGEEFINCYWASLAECLASK